MSIIDLSDTCADVIKERAERELREERERELIEREKERLRRPWWKKLFPYKVTIKIERR